jgi:hypothetical protein
MKLWTVTPASPPTKITHNGVLLPPVTAQKQISIARLTHGLDKTGGRPWPKDDSHHFSRREGTMIVFVLWEPKEKAKGTISVLVYDLDNRLMSSPSPPKDSKADFRPGQQYTTAWQIVTSDLPPGVYRADVRFNDAIAWRTFFRIME